MNGYVCFYRGKRAEVYADTLSQAKDKAQVAFKAPDKQRHEITVMLAEKDGKPVVHAADF